MTQWGKRYDRCLNCGSTDHAFRKRGFCTRCWPYAELLGKIDVGEAELRAPNGWCTDERWRREIRHSCSVRLAGLLENERRVRGEGELIAWHLHTELEHFQRTFKLGYARGTGLVSPIFPDAEARRVFYTWLIDWEAGHRHSQRISDLIQNVYDRILSEYLRNGSRELQ